MMFKTIVRSSVVIMLVAVLFGSSVSAHEIIRTHLPQDLRTWETYGTPSVSLHEVTLQGADREWVYIDIDARRIDKAYIALAAYIDKDDTRSSYSTKDRSRSGNPYLYAYYMDAKGKIQKYLTGSELMRTTRSGSDYVVYGIFPTISGTKTIRVFLKQGSVKGISNKGVNVTFAHPVLLQADSRRDAQSSVREYAQQELSYR